MIQLMEGGARVSDNHIRIGSLERHTDHLEHPGDALAPCDTLAGGPEACEALQEPFRFRGHAPQCLEGQREEFRTIQGSRTDLLDLEFRTSLCLKPCFTCRFVEFMTLNLHP